MRETYKPGTFLEMYNRSLGQEKRESSKNTTLYQRTSNFVKAAFITGLVGLTLTGCESSGSSGGNSNVQLHEARTGAPVQVNGDLLIDRNEYSTTVVGSSIRYDDIAGENRGQILYDSKDAALAHGSGSSSSSTTTVTDDTEPVYEAPAQAAPADDGNDDGGLL